MKYTETKHGNDGTDRSEAENSETSLATIGSRDVETQREDKGHGDGTSRSVNAIEK